MKYLSYINRIHNFWKRFGIAYAVWFIYLCHFFSCDQQLEITKLTTRENFGPTKYLRRHNGTMTLDPQDPRNLAHCLITLMSDTATGDVL